MFPEAFFGENEVTDSRSGDEKALEIERKFLIDALPDDLHRFPFKEISQGYIAVTPDGSEVRLRNKGGRFYQTVKTGNGKVRSEGETVLSEEQFLTFWPFTEGRRVEKARYEICLEQGVTVELDVFSGQCEGLVTAEVEFTSEEASNAFKPPPWFGREVTEDSAFKNKNLALKGIPESANR